MSLGLRFLTVKWDYDSSYLIKLLTGWHGLICKNPLIRAWQILLHSFNNIQQLFIGHLLCPRALKIQQWIKQSPCLMKLTFQRDNFRVVHYQRLYIPFGGRFKFQGPSSKGYWLHEMQWLVSLVSEKHCCLKPRPVQISHSNSSWFQAGNSFRVQGAGILIRLHSVSLPLPPAVCLSRLNLGNES